MPSGVLAKRKVAESATEGGVGARATVGKSSVVSQCALEAAQAVQSCFRRISESSDIVGGLRDVEYAVVVWPKGRGRQEM